LWIRNLHPVLPRPHWRDLPFSKRSVIKICKALLKF
jgi:hypothetical protein